MRFTSHARAIAAIAGVTLFAVSAASHAASAAAPSPEPKLATQRAPAAAEIATPASPSEVPEPKQWMLLLAGLGAIGWVARRRR